MRDWYNKDHPILKDFELGLAAQWGVVASIHKSKNFSLEDKNAIFAR